MTDNQISIEQQEEAKKQRSRLNIQNLIMKYFIYWKWFVVSIVICLIGAFVKLRYTTPIYNISATIMLQDKQKGNFNTQMQSLEDFGFIQSVNNIDNEIEVLRSKSLIKQTIIDLKLYINYQRSGYVGTQILYRNLPVTALLSPEDVEKLSSAFVFNIKLNDDSTYQLKYAYLDEERDETVKVKETISGWPYLLHSPVGDILLNRNNELPMEENMKITIVPPLALAKSYLSVLSVTPTSKTTSVATISFLDASRARGIDFVNRLVANYNLNANKEKNVVAQKTKAFIDARLYEVESQLGVTETDIEKFKKGAGLTDIEKNAEMVLKESSDYEKKLVEMNTQLSLLQYLRNYLKDPSKKMELIPSNVGLTDPSLGSLIEKYNQFVIERNRMLLTSTESNPSVAAITSSIKQLETSIATSTETLYRSMSITKADIERQANRFSSQISSAPTLEKEMAGINRQQKLKEGLYMMLLQKGEENALVMSATADNVKIIDDAIAGNHPVSPKRSVVWLFALFLGMAIPVGIIYLMELLRYKIEGRNDLNLLTSVPVLGDVSFSHGLKKGERAIVVKKNNNDMMAETFRSIRTNLQFTLTDPSHKVIMFTSTTSGEGKTFVSSNLAASMALLGKKVVLVGLDIRKPRLASMFDLTDKKKGITKFLSGDPDDKSLLFSQIFHTDTENLDIIPAGVIPPNPAELLARPNLQKAVDYLSEIYDYIVLDTPPVGAVIDSYVIARVANACVFVCRADYTAKSDLFVLDELKETGKLPNLSLVLNGVDMLKKKYGYYYGYGRYGYGRYGYGRYGYGRYGYGHYYNGNYGEEQKGDKLV